MNGASPRWLKGGARSATVFATLLLVASCSSSPSSAPKTSGPASSSGASVTQASTGVANVRIETRSGAMGTYLTDGSGRALYLFASDSAGKSSCSAACLKFWPALTSSAIPTVTGSAMSSMLSTITRADGIKQVAYAGHPLYYFAEDTTSGDTKGQGNDGFGAKWWLVAPSGNAITAAAASPTQSSAPSSYAGYGRN